MKYKLRDNMKFLSLTKDHFVESLLEINRICTVIWFRENEQIAFKMDDSTGTINIDDSIIFTDKGYLKCNNIQKEFFEEHQKDISNIEQYTEESSYFIVKYLIERNLFVEEKGYLKFRSTFEDKEYFIGFGDYLINFNEQIIPLTKERFNIMFEPVEIF